MIRRLTPGDVEACTQLRREALELEPLSFSSSPGEDFVQSFDVFRAVLSDPRQAIFGAFEPDLVGVVGIRGMPRRKLRHKAEIWGVYLRREYRGRGLAEKLLKEAIEFARSLQGVRQIHLSVTEHSVAAGKIYEKLGFVVWATEPAALNVDGVDVAERHMLLPLVVESAH
ncbi:MAG: GNAT family N-acetyltransferase [Vicinamibacterales bacterium]|nr:GNAT family N-acetyltransferase [Vicinamibacterales bacterium]